MTEVSYPLLLLDVPEDEADLVSGELFDLGATGVETRDATTLLKGAASVPTLVASFEDRETAEAARASFPERYGPRLDAIVGDAWRDEYKKYFHPFTLCPGLVVRPPWEEYAKAADEQVLVLEPGRAFGTGLHETTSLVADVLSTRRADLQGKPFLDVGTGSGILALVALVFGASRAVAIDVDPDAASLAAENAQANALGERLDASTTPIESVPGRFPFVVANIEAGVLSVIAAALHERTEPGGVLVLSGILAPQVNTQVEEVLRAHRALEHVETRIKGEWAALVLRRPPA